MRILLASSGSGSRGGGELFLVYLGQGLERLGHDVTLWVPDHPRMDELAAKFQAFGCILRDPYRNTYDRIGRSVSASIDFGTARRIAGRWRGWDVVHINKQNLEDGLELIGAAGLAGVPTACTVHLTQSARYLGARFGQIRDGVSRSILRRYAGPLVAVAEERAKALDEFLGQPGRALAILNGVPIPAEPSGVQPGKVLRVVGVGRMVEQKRPPVFLDIAGRIRRAAGVPVEFRWVGDGPLADAWDDEVRRRGMEDCVTRIAWTDDVARELADADVFLHVAAYEGLPLALLEAMAAGVPCIVTPNLRDELPFLSRAGAIIAGDDTDWDAVLGDRDALAARGVAGRALAEERFSADRMAEEYEALYERILAGTR